MMAAARTCIDKTGGDIDPIDGWACRYWVVNRHGETLSWTAMSTLAKSVIYYGSEKAVASAVSLKAGPLTMSFEPDTAVLRHIRLGDFEVARAIYAAVRDQNWATILPQLSNLQVQCEKASFTITFDVHCRKDAIDYFWRGRITGENAGRMTYQFDGEARSAFLRNRIGICVLHPITECSGKPLTIEHEDGLVEQGVFPKEIAPWQPFKEIRALSYDVHAGMRAEFRFAGDIFEMEDQRNWSDASFKTYCTPLRIPIPQQVNAGDRVHQVCTLSLSGAVKPVLPVVQGRPPQVSIATTPVFPLPPIGFCVARDAEPLTATEIARLKLLRPAHLRVDVRLSDPAYVARLERAAAESRQLGAPLHLAATVTDSANDQLKELRAHLDLVKPNIGLWLIFHESEEATNERWLILAREILQSYAPHVLFAGGTLDWFTEINRNRPGPDTPWFTCYSLTPQVHAFDNVTLVENLEAQALTVESAKKITAKPVVISPVTLRMRDNWGSHKEGFPPEVDPRQLSLLGAGWTLGSISRLAMTGHVQSLTYFETKGWRGLMEAETGPRMPEHFPSAHGMVFPLYHVFADIAEFGARQIYSSHCTHPLQSEAITLVNGQGKRRILVANLTGDAQDLKIKSGTATAQVRFLDETNFEQATRDPEAYRQGLGVRVEAVTAKIELKLLPFAVARVDLQ
jgi:D-apionolactonase